MQANNDIYSDNFIYLEFWTVFCLLIGTPNKTDLDPADSCNCL